MPMAGSTSSARRRARTLAGLALVVGACHDATDPDKQRIIGRIDPSSTAVPVIVAPEEVEVDVPFDIVVHTFGSFGCTTADGEDVDTDGGLVRIVPYDIVPRPGHRDVCPSEGYYLEHHVRVALPASGTARLRVVGADASSRDDRLDSVEVSVVVR